MDQAGDDTPDWLRQLGSNLESQPADSTAPENAGPSEDVPDWLARIRSRKDEEQGGIQPEEGETPDWLRELKGESEAPSTGDETVPDWLASLAPRKAESEIPAAGSEATGGETSDEDWLKQLASWEGGGEVEEQPLAQPEAELADQAAADASELDDQDWLRSLQGSNQEMPEAGSELAPAAETTDWLSALGATTEQTPIKETPAIEPAAETPDWLSALGATTEQTPIEETPAIEPAAETPDWLSALGAVPEETPAEETPAAEFAAETPDWLSALGATTEQTPIEETPAIEPAAETPDWLSVLGATTGETPAEETPAVEPVAETPDWLSALGATTGETPAEETPAIEPAAETPDWLSALGAVPEETPAEETPAIEAAAETPDWLSALGATTEQTPIEETPAIEPAAETPDWLSALGAVPEETPAEETPAAEFAAETPDWLSALGATTEQTPIEETPAIEPAAETPDWLSVLGATTGETPAEETPAIEAAAETPDWLSALGATTGETPAEETPAAEFAAETPDWLSALGAAAGETPAEETPAAEFAAETPDWLSALGAVPEENPIEETPAIEPVAETPDWLSALGAVPQETPIEETPAAEFAAETPDWLSALGAVPEETPAEETPAIEPAAETPDWLNASVEPTEAGEESGIPDWMRAYAEPTAEEPTQAAAAAASLDWLTGEAIEPDESAEPVSPLEPETPAQGAVSPFALDIPDWLIGGEQAALPEAGELKGGAVFSESVSEGNTPSAAPFTTPMEEEGAEALEPAQMPGWLAAMRPVESVAPQSVAKENDQRVEQTGPLAGLEGILQGEDVVRQYNRPPVYSGRLMLSERQRQNATLFEGLIAAETQAKPLKADNGIHPRRILRLVVGLLLVGLVLLSLFTPLPIFVPRVQTPESAGFVNSMNTIKAASGAHVLVAFDYQASLAGEMRLLSRQVIEDLEASNVTLVTMSTQINGTALADELLTEAQIYVPAYSLDGSSVNLGYLAGGAAGLQQLGNRIQQALPVTSDGQAAWSLPQLSGISSLADFDAILLLTDDPALARTWIEQTGQAQGDKALLVVASSQAAPMLLPYTQSGQIDGMLGGMAGGALYEQSTQRSLGQATTAWAAYQTGLLLAVILILGGIVLRTISNAIASTKSEKRA